MINFKLRQCPDLTIGHFYDMIFVAENVQSGGKMGVIYKLKPEIENFIIEQKKANINLSCRGIVTLIDEKFQTKVSKSSVNTIFKKSGLSMPVGRRAKKGKRKLEIVIQPEVIKSLTATETKPEVQEKPFPPTEKEIEKPFEAPVLQGQSLQKHQSLRP